MSRHLRDTYGRVRDLILLLAGLSGIGFETAVAPSPRAELLVVFVGMLGLPITVPFDRSIADRRSRRKEVPDA